MTRRSAIALFVLLLGLARPATADELLEQMHDKLSGLSAYEVRFTIDRFPSRAPDSFVDYEQPTESIVSDILGRPPNKLAVRMSEYGTEPFPFRQTTMLFDGTWQWMDVHRLSLPREAHRVSRLRQAIARPGKPFDTSAYLEGSGLFSGEDFPGTFEQILRLYSFAPAREERFEGKPADVYDGTLSSEAFQVYLKARGQDDPMQYIQRSIASLRLAVDPETALPLGYAQGETLDKPYIQVAISYASLDPQEVSDTRFRFEPPSGFYVFDDTARVAKSQLERGVIEAGSDLYTIVSGFVPRDRATPQKLQEHLEMAELDEALAMIKEEPQLLSTRDSWGPELLLVFVAAGHAEGTRALLELGADPNDAALDGNSVLHVAVRGGQLDALKELLAHKADPNARNWRGQAPLHLARDRAIADLLVAAGADPSLLDDEGRPARFVDPYGPEWLLEALGEALQEKDYEQVRQIALNDGASPAAYLDMSNTPYVQQFPSYSAWTPLGMATALDSEEGLRTLWEAWDSPRDSERRRMMATSLLRQARSGGVARYLVSQGADLAALRPNGRSLLYETDYNNALALLEAGIVPRRGTEKSRGDFLSLFAQRGSRQDGPTVGEAEWGRLFERVLKAGAPGDIDDRDPEGLLLGDAGPALLGATALHYAAEKGEELWVTWLLEHGAKPDLATEDGWTPLHLAVLSGNLQNVQALLSADASPSTVGANGWTPLHSASFGGKPAMVSLLLESGASVRATDELGNTPLHLAAGNGRVELVKLLLAQGAAKDVKNRDGETPADLVPPQNREALKGLLF